MRKNQIEKGGLYAAKVNGQLRKVKVLDILFAYNGQTHYSVLNMETGRKTRFRSAQKFKSTWTSYEGVKSKMVQKLQEKQSKNNAPTAAPHLIVTARAGTGKTTTLVEGLRRMKGMNSHFKPSNQQAAIWEAMEAGKDEASTVCFVAFNKAIAEELGQRVPNGCDAMTMHSMGFKAIRKSYNKVKVNNYRVQDIISEILGKDIRELRRHKSTLIKATEKLVGLCKMNLVNGTQDEVLSLASYYDVDLNGDEQQVLSLVPRVLERCKDVPADGKIDFNDMIWLPVILDLPVFRYDLLLVDEAQDLNQCQQQLALKAGRRLILCGDPKQAIYGFAGADSDSMPRMERILAERDGTDSVKNLPLTVTRRCYRAIVNEAQALVPDFQPLEGSRQGAISRQKYEEYHPNVKNGDMLLCRVNAPLVSQCFRFLKAGRKANIQGRDIGQGLINTIKKQNAHDLADLQMKLSDWHHNEAQKENNKRNPSEARVIALQDRYDCLCCFADESDNIEHLISKIEEVFTNEDTTGIKLSSIHKAKGLEAQRVFFLLPEGASVPHPMAKSHWQLGQEWNLKYVAVTRAIEELVYVS